MSNTVSTKKFIELKKRALYFINKMNSSAVEKHVQRQSLIKWCDRVIDESKVKSK